jgi:hypothetical protein
VPIDRPRLVVLTILDEPDSKRHYASQTAVPLFARIIAEIRRSTDWLTDVSADPADWVATEDPDHLVSVPDVLFLSPPLAEAELSKVGLSAEGVDREGQIIEQIPGPGTLCAMGQSVMLAVAPPRETASSAGSICPDLRGLSNRQVQSLAARLGIQVAIAGAGYVAKQRPVAGSRLGDDGIQVQMRATWR